MEVVKSLENQGSQGEVKKKGYLINLYALEEMVYGWGQ